MSRLVQFQVEHLRRGMTAGVNSDLSLLAAYFPSRELFPPSCSSIEARNTCCGGGAKVLVA